IQRTGAGTQGLVRCVKAETLLASSFVCAGATVRYIKQQSPARVTLVSTGPDGEDQACAEYIAALLRNKRPDTARLLDHAHDAGQQRIDYALSKGLITEAQRDEFAADLDCCRALDRFDFAMVVQRRGGLLVIETAH
ncbi:MAG: 2-phosphosulfolactate phosphatase, partial [Gammaproteobacteria bacterium]|nr:2-phosphosulfolactate phosphatase [Gammaproteobacteria bacterium]